MQNTKLSLLILLIIIALATISLVVHSEDFLSAKNSTEDFSDFVEATMTDPNAQQKQQEKDEFNRRREERRKQKEAEQQSIQTYEQGLGENLGVNPIVYLSGKSKAEIYRLRKKFVAQSIFANANYQPSEEVFGGIVDGKPWIDANPCTIGSTGLQGTNKESEESRFISNPNMLVAIEYPFNFSNYKSQSWCEESETKLIPLEIRYLKEKNEIIVVYNYLPFMAPVGNKWFYVFNGINARDFGYKYAYVDNSKSTYKPHYKDPVNISNSVIEFQNFIHLGGACGHEGGCNNGSPRQTFLEFQDNFTEYKYKYREIYIKLWKNRPASTNSPADITERIILKWS